MVAFDQHCENLSSFVPSPSDHVLLNRICSMKNKRTKIDDYALIQRKKNTHFHVVLPLEKTISHILEHIKFNQNFNDANFLILNSMGLVKAFHF